MTTIYKYKLDPQQVQPLALPDGAQILSAGTQGGEIFIWALVDTNKIPTPRFISVFATGEPIDYPILAARLRFINTVSPAPGLIFHVFENI